MKYEKLSTELFQIKSEQDFNALAIEVFKFQHSENDVYRKYCNLLKVDAKKVQDIDQIPYLPIEFFKIYDVINKNHQAQKVFKSSGTGSIIKRSSHLVSDIDLYIKSFSNSFKLFIGDVSKMQFFSLLPNYESNPESSLIYMIDHLISQSPVKDKKPYQVNETLVKALKSDKNSKHLKVLFGVSFALLDLADKYKLNLENTILIETGGMKGKRQEITRNEMYSILKNRLNPKAIYSEYGMTELLSQAYSKNDGLFSCPPWMKVRIRDLHDPLNPSLKGSGGIDIIDLANINSCSFISTSDLGRIHTNGSFEVLGRLDFSEIRGCNLLHE